VCACVSMCVCMCVSVHVCVFVRSSECATKTSTRKYIIKGLSINMRARVRTRVCVFLYQGVKVQRHLRVS